MKLRAWPSLFSKKKPEVKASLKAPLRPVRHDMTLERWQNDDALVTWARTSDEFAYILSIAHNKQPTGYPIRGEAVTDTQCVVELGRKEGYADLENVLLALRDLPKTAAQEIPADYDDTDYSKETAQV